MLRKLYYKIVNFIHFSRYSFSWVSIFLQVFTLVSSLLVWLLYFGVELSFMSVIVLMIIFLIFFAISGYILFKSKAQNIDAVMATWRNPITEAGTEVIYAGLVELLKKNNIEIPKCYREWGLKSWDDVKKIYTVFNYQHGLGAGADKVVKKYFGGENN
ncbi:MAG: hypothetical protein ACTSPL_04205 [Candidatus Odinarchaeia archaeon]